MANRFIESFDEIASADLPKRFSNVSSVAAVNASGRNSGSALRLPNWNQGVDIVLSDSQATIIIGFAFKTSAIPSDRILFTLIGSDGTVHVTYRMTAAGNITANRATATLLGTSAFVALINTFYYLEFKTTISDTVGVAELRVNGVVDASLALSSQDTKNAGATATVNTLRIVNGGSGDSANIDIDDLYVNDGAGGVDDTYWGDVRVIAKSVDGAGNSAQFTPSTGSNWQNVDDSTPDGDSTYNESSTVNHIDSMTTAALGVTGTVKGVGLSVYARKTDAGVGSLAPLWRISGTDFAGTGVALSTDYTYVTQLYRVSPSSSSAWTTSEIDGAEIGYKRTA